MVDDLVNSLTSTSVLPLDVDRLPKDLHDRRTKQALQRDFEATAQSVNALATGSLFARAAYFWALDLVPLEVGIPKDLKDKIKKIALASVFAADASLWPEQTISFQFLSQVFHLAATL